MSEYLKGHVPISTDLLRIVSLSLKQSTLYLNALAKAIDEPEVRAALLKSARANVELVQMLDDTAKGIGA